MSAVKIHSFITRRPGPTMYAFEFKVARALIQQNISAQTWIIYDPEISVKSVCSKGKNIQTKKQIRARNRVTWQGTCSLSPPQRLLWVTGRLRSGETKKNPATASAKEQGSVFARLQLPTLTSALLAHVMGKKLVEEEAPASEVSESIDASKRMQTQVFICLQTILLWRKSKKVIISFKSLRRGRKR